MSLSQRIKSDIDIVKTKISYAEINNKEKDKIEENYFKFIRAYNLIVEKLYKIQSMQKEIKSITKNSMSVRKQQIEDYVTYCLSTVFDDGYICQIDIRPWRDTIISNLKLYTENELGERDYFIPADQNGGLCRQVTALSSGIAIAKLMGCKWMMLDEALNGGDDVKLQKAQSIIDEYLKDEDAVMLLNEHNLSIFKSLNCKISYLHKEGKGKTGYVVFDSVEEQSGWDLNEQGIII